MAVRNSLDADEDIIRIYAYGVEDYGASAAERYLFDLLDAIERLSDNPYAVPVRLRRGGQEYRLLPFGAHHVFYVIENEDVLVVRILHGSANWTNHL
jgi:toxin ParE1/3/4